MEKSSCCSSKIQIITANGGKLEAKSLINKKQAERYKECNNEIFKCLEPVFNKNEHPNIDNIIKELKKSISKVNKDVDEIFWYLSLLNDPNKTVTPKEVIKMLANTNKDSQNPKEGKNYMTLLRKLLEYTVLDGSEEEEAYSEFITDYQAIGGTATVRDFLTTFYEYIEEEENAKESELAQIGAKTNSIEDFRQKLHKIKETRTLSDVDRNVIDSILNHHVKFSDDQLFSILFNSVFSGVKITAKSIADFANELGKPELQGNENNFNLILIYLLRNDFDDLAKCLYVITKDYILEFVIIFLLKLITKQRSDLSFDKDGKLLSIAVRRYCQNISTIDENNKFINKYLALLKDTPQNFVWKCFRPDTTGVYSPDIVFAENSCEILNDIRFAIRSNDFEAIINKLNDESTLQISDPILEYVISDLIKLNGLQIEKLNSKILIKIINVLNSQLEKCKEDEKRAKLRSFITKCRDQSIKYIVDEKSVPLYPL